MNEGELRFWETVVAAWIGRADGDWTLDDNLRDGVEIADRAVQARRDAVAAWGSK